MAHSHRTHSFSSFAKQNGKAQTGGDSRICQTPTVAPAEPGVFPVVIKRHKHLDQTSRLIEVHKETYFQSSAFPRQLDPMFPNSAFGPADITLPAHRKPIAPRFRGLP
jgi:hypothetical protein